MRKYRITRQNKAYVWVRSASFGCYGPRGLSMRVPRETFEADWTRLPGNLAIHKGVNRMPNAEVRDAAT